MDRSIRTSVLAWGMAVSTALMPFVARAGAISGGLQNAATNAGYSTAVPGDKALPYLIANIVQIAISIVGLIFFVQIVYGGYLWMTARGEREQAEKAQEVLRRSVIGLIIVLAAWSISAFIVKQLELRV